MSPLRLTALNSTLPLPSETWVQQSAVNWMATLALPAGTATGAAGSAAATTGAAAAGAVAAGATAAGAGVGAVAAAGTCACAAGAGVAFAAGVCAGLAGTCSAAASGCSPAACSSGNGALSGCWPAVTAWSSGSSSGWICVVPSALSTSTCSRAILARSLPRKLPWSCHQTKPPPTTATSSNRLTPRRMLCDRRTGSSMRPSECTSLPLAWVPVYWSKASTNAAWSRSISLA
ncbi:hypothetical protein D3C76_1152540 [compost metagenome]